MLPLLNRICTKEYTVPGTGQTIPVGTPIVISLLGFARDAQHFPDPLEYRPERFVAGVQPAPYTEDAFLPYGDGPRRCIGNHGEARESVLHNNNRSKWRRYPDGENDSENIRHQAAGRLSIRAGVCGRVGVRELWHYVARARRHSHANSAPLTLACVC